MIRNKKLVKRRNDLFIDWQTESKPVCVTHEEMNDLVSDIDLSKVARYRSFLPTWCNKSYFIEEVNAKKNGKGKSIRVQLYKKDENGNISRYYTNTIDNSKNKMTQRLNANPGNLAYNTVKEFFFKKHGITFKKAFGTVGSDIKDCVPRQFYWIDRSVVNLELEHVSCVDFCSHYPSNLCGSLPDSHTAKEVNGRVKPTKEYPFAFYLKSRCVAEYNKYDTHDWLDSKFMKSLYFKEQLIDMININDEDEITILMKPSKYELTDAMEFFYSRRHENEIYKLIMNAFIGTLHSVSYKSKKYAHIAAIAIARANEKMRKLAESIRKPIHICVDGMIYLDSVKLGVEEKKLTLCNQEFFDCSFKMTGMNVYVAMKNNEVIKFRHGAYDSRDDKKDIDYCEGFEYLNHLQRATNIQKTLTILDKIKEAN